jgi:hypothetical protein
MSIQKNINYIKYLMMVGNILLLFIVSFHFRDYYLSLNSCEKETLFDMNSKRSSECNYNALKYILDGLPRERAYSIAAEKIRN